MDINPNAPKIVSRDRAKCMRSLSTLTKLKQHVELPGTPDSKGYSWCLHIHKHRLTIGGEANSSEL